MADIKIQISGTVTIGKMFDIHDNQTVVNNVTVPGGEKPTGTKKTGGEVGSAPTDTVGRLTPIFKGNVREAEAFLSRIDGAKPTAVTEEVNRLLRAGMVTRSGCKGDLWQVLHQGGYYRPSQSNWNKQVNS